MWLTAKEFVRVVYQLSKDILQICRAKTRHVVCLQTLFQLEINHEICFYFICVHLYTYKFVKMNLRCCWRLIYILEILHNFLNSFLCAMDSNINTKMEYQKVTAFVIFLYYLHIYIYIRAKFQSTIFIKRQLLCTIKFRIH